MLVIGVGAVVVVLHFVPLLLHPFLLLATRVQFLNCSLSGQASKHVKSTISMSNVVLAFTCIWV